MVSRKTRKSGQKSGRRLPIFGNLTPSEFESFCYDLLCGMGFERVDWRKGAVQEHSPADRGRDIVCYLRVQELHDSHSEQKWFVECKHTIRAVPPEKLQSALAWARAERPDKLLFAVSGFLSNPCKDYVGRLIAEERPPFKIEWWEGPRLMQLAQASAKLMRKYQLAGDYPFLDLLHPAHLEFLHKPPRNSLDFLFRILDRLEPAERNEAMWLTYLCFVDPEMPTSFTGRETVGELIGSSVSYEAFRRKCYEAVGLLPEFVVVRAIIGVTLDYVFRMADSTSINEDIERHKSAAAHFTEELAKNPGEPLASDLRACLKMSQKSIKQVPERAEKWYGIYAYFCESVVLKLLLEPLTALPTDVTS